MNEYQQALMRIIELEDKNVELRRMAERAMGAVDGEFALCPFCDAMYWAGRIGHKEDCAFALLTKENNDEA